MEYISIYYSKYYIVGAGIGCYTYFLPSYRVQFAGLEGSHFKGCTKGEGEGGEGKEGIIGWGGGILAL